MVGDNSSTRIVIVGTTGSGKTTLARHLAQRLAIPHIELDALYWKPNWQSTETEILRSRTLEALSGNTWVVDGNYGQVRDIVWGKATMLIWLDYPLYVIYWRLFWRTIKRVLTREQLWNSNQERLRNQFSKDSLFLYAWTSSRRRKITYPQAFQQPEFAHLKIHRFTSPRQTERWLDSLK